MMFSFYACQEVLDQTGAEADLTERLVVEPPELFLNSYLGIDIEGNEKSCKDMDDLFCSEEFTDSDQYALDCQRNGDVAIQCACHDWICVDSDNLKNQEKPLRVTGRDIDGNIDSCEPFDYRVDGQEVMCTMEFTEEDQFAIDCQADGYEVVQCGCHKFLCLE